MTFSVESKRKKIDTIKKQYPNALVIDFTSKGSIPWIKFSPFYPHGNIPVPFSSGYVSDSVEGIWQGLKVFESADIDLAKFHVKSMKGLKRTVRRFGKVLGHRQGVEGENLLPYQQARFQIYLPSYRWMLEHCVPREITELKRMGQSQQIVLLDYETNGDIENLTKPLSHAALAIKYLQEDWPNENAR